ncbi:sporulation protein YqfC [Candidatus Formimonas warabiya]|uniref:Sporulation protein YqfC n=1 Tax=Formimonas warabiya TaxID=1761012 RepID=A0A3G1KYM7_FORW1|nr:sporulation protein YqfC [Candidatus Formimonas warabiya]ATW27315.1 sporulation protein YqfC [Candidatus Formimonas warabiya]
MRTNKQVLRGQRAKFKSAFADLLEIPPDIALNLPRITMIGNLQLNIENHKGIVEYTDSKIRVLVARGTLDIEGSNLILRNIQLDEIMINGEILQIKVSISG